MENNFSTSRLYYQDSYLFKITSTVEETKREGDFLLIRFDNTIFHPQGGGQPSDDGDISYESKAYPVLSLVTNKDSDEVWHKITCSDDSIFAKGTKCELSINSEKRILNAKLHSAGHLIDVAISNLDFELTPVKGYHFPEGPYVEYGGKLPENQKEFIEKLQENIDALILNSDKNFKAIKNFYKFEDASKLFLVPSFVPKDKMTRYVKLDKTDVGRPCGGTHVNNISEIGKMIISKIAKKGKNLRISYLIK